MNLGESLHSPSSVVFCIQYPSLISGVRCGGIGVAAGFEGVGRADMRSDVSVGSRVWVMVLVGVDGGVTVFVVPTVAATAGVTT
jgi:hypothetical protein